MKILLELQQVEGMVFWLLLLNMFWVLVMFVVAVVGGEGFVEFGAYVYIYILKLVLFI